MSTSQHAATLMRSTYGLVWILAVMVVSRTRSGVNACLLAGADTGTCAEPDQFASYMPFCSSVVQYTACVPRDESLWTNHSTTSKDRFVQQMFNKIIVQRKLYETNQTLHNKKIDEWGTRHQIIPRFSDNPDCENAFKNYFCWMNFPRCDAEGRSLLVCRSVCENYFTACQQSSDLWRCGEPKYVNARSPEISTTWINKQYVYYRAPFPGSPFKTNAFDSNHKPLVVCTPSLENPASMIRPVGVQWIGVLFVVGVSVLL